MVDLSHVEIMVKCNLNIIHLVFGTSLTMVILLHYHSPYMYCGNIKDDNIAIYFQIMVTLIM